MYEYTPAQMSHLEPPVETKANDSQRRQYWVRETAARGEYTVNCYIDEAYVYYTDHGKPHLTRPSYLAWPH